MKMKISSLQIFVLKEVMIEGMMTLVVERFFFDASVEDDTKRVQSALCTRMRIVFYAIRLGPKTSVCREECHCHVYCIRP